MSASLLDTDIDDTDPMGELVEGEHQVIHVPNTLRAKTGSGERVDPERIKAAEKAVLGMADDFRIWAMEDVAQMRDIIADCSAGSLHVVDERERIYDISHNVKGQGSTFGYTLLTSVADNLCNFLDRQNELNSEHLPVMAAHTEALSAILRFNVKGSDNPTGQEIVRSLHELITKQPVKPRV
ncbi:MAG: Hpt domain-containing protein [Minwuia sp.]|nr:Hpt domain-containing protein [Minwuia sp.]